MFALSDTIGEPDSLARDFARLECSAGNDTVASVPPVWFSDRETIATLGWVNLVVVVDESGTLSCMVVVSSGFEHSVVGTGVRSGTSTRLWVVQVKIDRS